MNKKYKTKKELDLEKQKLGIEKNKKYCNGCEKWFDSGNYSKHHGEKCLIGTIKEYIPQIKTMYLSGTKITKIARDLKIKYRPIYKLKENNII